jgi:hypothetical protein
LDRCCSLSYWLSADTSNGLWPNRHENGILFNYVSGRRRMAEITDFIEAG